MYEEAIDRFCEERRYRIIHGYRLWMEFASYWRDCKVVDFQQIAHHKLEELRDFLRQRGVWVERWSITIALACTVNFWTGWPHDEPFDSTPFIAPVGSVGIVQRFQSDEYDVCYDEEEYKTRLFERIVAEGEYEDALELSVQQPPEPPVQQTTEPSMQQPLDRSIPTAVPADQSNGLDQASYSVENGPEDVPYKLASEASHASEAPVATDSPVAPDFSVASVQQHQPIKSFVSETSRSPNSETINHASYEEKNWPGNIEPNDVASAKVIWHTNSIATDFASAEVIATPTLNGPAYHQLADMPSPTDTPPPPPYKSDESDQLPPPILTTSNVDRVRRNFVISSIFKWPEMIKFNSNISTFDQQRRIHRLHHHSYLRRPPNGQSNGLIYPHQATPSTCLPTFAPSVSFKHQTG